MSDRINCLQLGTVSWNETYKVPENINIDFIREIKGVPKTQYDLVFLDRNPQDGEAAILFNAIKAHTLFITDNVQVTGKTKELYRSKCGRVLHQKDVQDFLLNDARNFYPFSYGEKSRPDWIEIAYRFDGKVKWHGGYSISLKGDFGSVFRQAACWRYNLPIPNGRAIDLWLEYEKTPGIEIKLKIYRFPSGSVSDITRIWEFDEKQLKDIVTIDNDDSVDSTIFMSLMAKGRGELRIVAIHDRFSRRGYGTFLPGGERFVTSKREEVFAYFDPMDMKPPLNVYFSGYKTQEGFEGYNMMRSFGAPYLLISESRLEGGGFYMGGEAFEENIRSVISKYLYKLGFGEDELILSGLSMGTYGAMYYACDLRPHTVLIGKPLASVGDIATNERITRPGGFATSLDVMLNLCGNLGTVAAQELNARFWDKFDKARFKDTKFVVSYMIEDDYDRGAYDELVSHLADKETIIYGKGLHGRHNDNSSGIVQWFKSQYKKILSQDFGR